MMNHEERLNRIFQKAEEKKRRKTIWTRTIAAVAVCLICTVSAVGAAMSGHRQELPTVPLTDSQTQTATPPSSNAGQSAQQSTTDSAHTEVSDSVTQAGEQAPSAPQNTDETVPTEPSLADPPTSDPAQAEESQPAQTTTPNVTQEVTDAPQTTTTPSTTLPDASQTTQPSTAPGSADDEELLGSVTQPATEDSPNLPPADSELEQPFYFVYLDSTESAILSALNNGDSSLQGTIQGISSPSQPLLLISRSFFEQYTAADDQEVLRAKMYIFAENNEQIIAFLSEYALSYNSSGDSYTVFITRSQALQLASAQMPENFRVLVTTF